MCSNGGQFLCTYGSDTMFSYPSRPGTRKRCSYTSMCVGVVSKRGGELWPNRYVSFVVAGAGARTSSLYYVHRQESSMHLPLPCASGQAQVVHRTWPLALIKSIDAGFSFRRYAREAVVCLRDRLQQSIVPICWPEDNTAQRETVCGKRNRNYATCCYPLPYHPPSAKIFIRALRSRISTWGHAAWGHGETFVWRTFLFLKVWKEHIAFFNPWMEQQP